MGFTHIFGFASYSGTNVVCLIQFQQKQEFLFLYNLTSYKDYLVSWIDTRTEPLQSAPWHLAPASTSSWPSWLSSTALSGLLRKAHQAGDMNGDLCVPRTSDAAGYSLSFLPSVLSPQCSGNLQSEYGETRGADKSEGHTLGWLFPGLTMLLFVLTVPYREWICDTSDRFNHKLRSDTSTKEWSVIHFSH